MTVEVIRQTPIGVSMERLSNWVRLFSNELLNRRTAFKKQDQTKTLVLVFVGTKQIQSLNRKYRKKNKPTDVLSFHGSYSGHLGDLVLCPRVIKKQAKEHRMTFKHEMAYMILHGILHLLGYEHESSPRKAKIMFELQDTIFQSLYQRL